MSVYVRWYNKVVEGEIEKEDDLFGMTAIKMPIQGVTVIALFHPKNIFKTAQEACGDYPKKFTIDTWVPDIPDKSFSESINEAKRAIEDPDWLALQKFKEEHWNHERNMLQLDYWQEYDRMFHAYMRRKLQMDKPQQMEPMKIERQETPEEAKWQKPASINQVEVKPVPAAKPDDTKVTPLSIGKKVTVTELTLF